MTETPYNSVNDKRLQALIKWLSVNNFCYNKLTVASADAGFRRYFRLHKDNSTLIAVDSPPEYEDTPAFLDIAGRLARTGLRSPQIHCYSLENGFLVVEDFGQTHIQQMLQGAPDNAELKLDLYQKAVHAIATMQQSTDTTDLPLCDRDFLLSELELFPLWYLKKHLGKPIDRAQQTILDNTFDVIVKSATDQPYKFMHRDFHCRNLMVLNNNDLGIIDFQGAMTGPVTYDPVSLLKDAYQDLPADIQTTLLEQHRLSLTPEVDKQTYSRWYDFIGLQRHLKILGIFCRLNYRDNKPNYLTNLPRVRQQVESVITKYPELAAFDRLFSAYHNNQSMA